MDLKIAVMDGKVDGVCRGVGADARRETNGVGRLAQWTIPHGHAIRIEFC